MKKQIDKLISEHTEGYQKYGLKLSIGDFKLLQKLMANEYQIKEYTAKYNSIWSHKHISEDVYATVGTILFTNFELNVYRAIDYDGEAEFKAVDEVDKKIFKNSKSESKIKNS